MASQEALNKALHNLCPTHDNGILGLMELLHLGADPIADDCKALKLAVMCENKKVVDVLFAMGCYNDAACQEHVRSTGLMCQEPNIRSSLVEFNDYAIKKLGWEVGYIMESILPVGFPSQKLMMY